MANYRYIRFSDPLYERDHLRFMTFYSPALGGRGDVTLFVPPGAETGQNLPLVVLLHGVYSSHWAWSMMGGAHRTTLELIEAGELGPLVVAMPSDGLRGDGSGYLRHDGGADYERWITDDVVGCLTESLPALSSRSPLFLAGLSMGGYGALRLGAKYAGRFAGLSAHSSITHLRQFAAFVEEPLERYGDPERVDLDPLYWMERNRAELPPFRFDCGTGDPLIEENRQLHNSLLARDIPHVYEEFEGGHTWDYWREHLRETLRFFSHLLRAR